MKRGKIESIIPKKDEVEINQVLNNIRNTCPFCEKQFDNAKKVENYVMCIENRINAINCKRTCHTVRALKEHKMIHRSDYFFECNICHVKYKSEDSLKKHDMQNSIAITNRNIYVNIVAVATNWRQTWLITWRDYFSELQICRFCRKEVKNVKIHEWRHQKRDKEMKYVHMCHSCHKKFLYRDWTIIWGSTKKILDVRAVAKSIMEHVNQWITKDSRSQVKILTLSYVKKRFLPAVIFISTHIRIRRCLRGRFYSAFWDTEDIILDHFRRCNTIHPEIAELARNYLQKL